MGLEELKSDWDSIGKSNDKSHISDEAIKVVLKRKSRWFVHKILIVDLVLLLVYFYFIVLTVFRFDELRIFYLEVLAVISIVLLASLFIMRFIKLLNAYRNNFLRDAHTIAVQKLAKQMVKTQRFYIANIISGFLLLVLLIVLSTKIYNEYDVTRSPYFWSIIIPGSFIFIFLVNRWRRKYYAKALQVSAELLEELK